MQQELEAKPPDQALSVEPAEDRAGRLAVLDGWRATSILLVLAAHLLPLGPRILRLNETAALMGMSLFFTLSGFLITRFLLRHGDVRIFVIRRLIRIVPLSWLAMLITLTMDRGTIEEWLANFLFFANLPPQRLTEAGSHLWSLCVEMQFYMGVALLYWVCGKRGLLILPLLCLGVTALRLSAGATVDIVTWLRIDEILAGALVALIFEGYSGERVKAWLGRLNVYAMLALLFVCSHPDMGSLLYLRPYAGALLVAVSLFRVPSLLHRLLVNPIAMYIAHVSYALYVIHGVLRFTWLGEGNTLAKYVKRPLLIAITFALAHLSTNYLEHPLVSWAKRKTTRDSKSASARA